jgi:cytochrome d ubiquinol oxidase subunit I
MGDPVFLSRIQFAVTIGFHFLFPPISTGLAWLLVYVEFKAWRTGDPTWEAVGRLFGKLLALTFTVGVATGIVMEFQFGANWSEYCKFVGDVFGPLLAFEAITAFFLESTFLGLYLFGRGRIQPGLTWFSILMVAVGATLSAFWILVANSWQQTPAGFEIIQGRAELTDFAAAVFNPSMGVRFFHTFTACILCGSFFMAAVSAYRLLGNSESRPDRKSLAAAVILGLTASILAAFPTGHEHAKQVALTQPEKFAAIEGLYETESNVPIVVFGLVKDDPPQLKAKTTLPIPGLLGWLAFGDFHAEIDGISSFPAENRPPLWMTFVSFHNMVILGILFQAVMFLSVVQWWRRRLWVSRKLLMALIGCMPLSLVAIQFGWVTAELGRQPWAVYHLLRTADAASPTVPAGQILFSILLYSAIYGLLLVLYLFLLEREVSHGLKETAAIQEAAP